jgi:predicted MFS family arabinose efflux permease
MPTPYTVINSTDTTNLYTIFKFVNNSINNTFMPIMLLVIWVVAFIGSISEGRQASRAFIWASFLCSILAIVLALVGMLNRQYMYLLFLLVGAGVIWDKLQNAPGI